MNMTKPGVYAMLHISELEEFKANFYKNREPNTTLRIRYRGPRAKWRADVLKKDADGFTAYIYKN